MIKIVTIIDSVGSPYLQGICWSSTMSKACCNRHISYRYFALSITMRNIPAVLWTAAKERKTQKDFWQSDQRWRVTNARETGKNKINCFLQDANGVWQMLTGSRHPASTINILLFYYSIFTKMYISIPPSFDAYIAYQKYLIPRIF